MSLLTRRRFLAGFGAAVGTAAVVGGAVAGQPAQTQNFPSALENVKKQSIGKVVIWANQNKINKFFLEGLEKEVGEMHAGFGDGKTYKNVSLVLDRPINPKNPEAVLQLIVDGKTGPELKSYEFTKALDYARAYHEKFFPVVVSQASLEQRR